MIISRCLVVLFLCLPVFIGTARASNVCEQPEESPSIRIDVSADAPIIDHDHTRADLKGFDIATVSPYGDARNVHINGLMRGAIALETQMALAWQHSADAAKADDNCFWYNRVGLNIKLSPTIYIAREIPETSCFYNAVLQHEYKHYDMDYATAKDFQLILQDELERFVRETGIIGPYAAADTDQAKMNLSKRLELMIHGVNDRLKDERVKRQSMIDTREEYDRVARTCKQDVGMM